MAIPFFYSLRNLWTRRLTTMLTASGMALVVFVFTAILMLAEGLQTTLVETGSSDNVVVIRKGSVSEVQSGVERQQASVVETDPEIAVGQDGKKMAVREIVVLISLPKRDRDKPANVVIRGIGDASVDLRPQVRMVEGRLPQRGSVEIMAGMNIARRFKGGGIGEILRFGMRDWRIVGIFDAANTEIGRAHV
jgi:putative ABC transport system permease protein